MMLNFFGAKKKTDGCRVAVGAACLCLLLEMTIVMTMVISRRDQNGQPRMENGVTLKQRLNVSKESSSSGRVHRSWSREHF